MSNAKILVLTFMALLAIRANAQNDSFREAMDACFTETGVSKPERGVRPSDEDRQKIEACLSAKGIERPSRPERGGGGFAGGGGNDSVVREAMKACATENNLQPPQPGSRPSDEDRATMESCLAAKGIQPPQRGQGGPRPQRSSSGVSAQ